MGNPLKYQAQTCFLISILILIPVVVHINEIESELKFLIYTYLGTSALFLSLSAVFLLLYIKRGGGIARDIDQSMIEAKEYIDEDMISKEYNICGRPKWVVFIFFSWIILFCIYLASTVLKARIVGGSLFVDFNLYNLIMFVTFMIGLYFYWKMDPNGYLILASVCFYNIFRIVAMMRYFELLVWLYPVLSLVAVRKEFFKS